MCASGMFDGTLETVLQPRKRFRIETFISIMDSMLGALQHRLNAYEAISANFSFLSNLNTSSNSDITIAAERLVRAYPEDLEEDLSVELMQFASFVKSTQVQQTLASKEPDVNIGNELRLFLLLTELSLDQTFPNVYIINVSHIPLHDDYKL